MLSAALVPPLKPGKIADSDAFNTQVALCCFVKASSARHGYAGFVAAFTASVTLTGTECGGLGCAECAPAASKTAEQPAEHS